MDAEPFILTAVGTTAQEAFQQTVLATRRVYGTHSQRLLATKSHYCLFKEYPFPLPVTGTDEQLAVRRADIATWLDDGDVRIEDARDPAGCIPLKYVDDARILYAFFGMAIRPEETVDGRV